MFKITINELGNNKISFRVFNEFNQQLSDMHIKGQKENKKMLLERIRRPIMAQGYSVAVDDQTVN